MGQRGDKIYDEIIKELGAQGWTVEPTKGGHFKAIPFDKEREIVTFGPSGEAHALKNVLSMLRKSGFVWPSPSLGRAKLGDVLGAALAGKGGASVVANGVSVIANGLASDYTGVESEPLSEPSSEAPRSVDDLFAALKEARTMLKLAGERAEARKKAYLEAKAEYDEAEKERLLREKAFATAKAAFDRAIAKLAD